MGERLARVDGQVETAMSNDDGGRVVTWEVEAEARFPKPVKRVKAPKPLRPRQAAPGEPRKYSTLSRGVRIKWKPARRIARETPAEKIHKKLIRQARVCAVAKYSGAHPCTRILVVAHLGPGGGTGRKHGDWTQSTLMCSDDPRNGRKGHHQDVDQRRRAFSPERMTDDELAAWKEHEIHLAREFVAGRRMVSA